MYIHAHGVELLEAVHTVHQEHNSAATLHCLYRPRQEVGGHGLKVLEDTHPVSVAEDLVGLVVITVADVGRRHKHLEGVLLVNLHLTILDLLVQLLHLFLPVARKSKLLLVTPEDIWPRLDCGLGEHVVEDNHLVPGLVSDHDKHRPPTLANAIFNQQPHSVINLFPDHDFYFVVTLLLKQHYLKQLSRDENQREHKMDVVFMEDIFQVLAQKTETSTHVHRTR